ncbi:hypothetical protein BJX68DRAFT_258802 [Aspergillus pseudodeflectus]|uniref:Zn(2)-C6 fungal-type domain-containing protein n=1 Tax=Aspergillus pseudodeflectus TaxID=176178 RepID=A0ABR4JK93_9EURO
MRSCKQCRQAKRKCIRSETDLFAPCGRCLRHHLACSSAQPPSSKRKHQLAPRAIFSDSPSPSASQPISNLPRKAVDDFLADQEAVVELASNYLTKIHDRPHSIFHAPTLSSRIRQKSVSKALLLAISDGEIAHSFLDGRMQAPLRNNMEQICLENIQTCILVANLCAAHANPSSEFLFFQMAVAMVQLIDIPAPNAKDDVITADIKIRVWWALFMADNWCSSSLGLPRQMKEFRRPPLPLEEPPGLWAHMITLVELFGQIQDLNRSVVNGGELTNDKIADATEHLSHKIDSWQAALPSDMILTESNIMEHTRRGNGGAFFALHLGFHHYATLLYYQYLDNQLPSTSRTERFAESCKYHALQYSKLLSLGRQQSGCETVYPTVGHMTTVSSSVLLHTLLFGTEDELAQSRRCLHANFEALLELEQYWPGVRSMINRLISFQNTCLLFAHAHMHRLDCWMTRFLFEYALPFDEKTISDPHSASELKIISSQTEVFAQMGRLVMFDEWSA